MSIQVVDLKKMKVSKRELDDVDTMMRMVNERQKQRELEAANDRDGYVDAEYEDAPHIVDDLGWPTVDWQAVWSGIVVFAMMAFIIILLTLV